LAFLFGDDMRDTWTVSLGEDAERGRKPGHLDLAGSARPQGVIADASLDAALRTAGKVPGNASLTFLSCLSLLHGSLIPARPPCVHRGCSWNGAMGNSGG